jgi:hypothetical protein
VQSLRAAAAAPFHDCKVGLRPGQYNRPPAPAVDRPGRSRHNPRAMIAEFLTALFKAGLPVGVTAWLLTWWALRNGYLGDVEGLRDVEREIKRLGKDKEKRKQADVVQRKWLALGGGFYGVVAFLTWLVIEGRDLWGFFASFDGFAAFFDQFSINMLVGLFIEAITNTFFAIAWPVYWMQGFSGRYLWAWFVAAYAGYWAGSQLAIRQYRAARGAAEHGNDGNGEPR